MLELTLVRHASTALNEQRRYQGRIDPPLSERGRTEAARLAGRLRGAPFDVLASADSLRCMQTLRTLCPGREHRVEPGWGELDFGAWDGHTYEQCQARDPELLRRWIDDPLGTTPPGGEGWPHFQQRVDAALAALPPEGHALVVASGGPIRRVLAAALGLEWRQVVLMQLSPCGLTRLALHPDGGHLLTLNDTAHLEP